MERGSAIEGTSHAATVRITIENLTGPGSVVATEADPGCRNSLEHHLSR